MKRYLPIPIATLLLALTMDATANILPAGKDTGDIMVGVTGMTVALKGGKLLVTEVAPDTPAEGKLEMNDTLLAVDGASLAIQDPRHPLGFAINAAEGRDGKMAFDIERAGTARKVVIQLEPIGSYSRSYPVDCPKSRRIVDETAAFILKHGGPGEGINGNLEGLFPLSTGEKKYLPALERYARALAEKNCGRSTWHLGYSGIFLGEYFLATGDQRVLPALKARCDALKSVIWFYELSRMPGGGFRTPWFPGHGTIGKVPLYQTGLIAMAYTAHLKNLRICGKPRTRHSVPHRPTAVEASPATDDFHRTDFIEGAVIGEKPHKIAAVFTTLYNADGSVLPTTANAEKNDARKKRMPAAWYARMMRHYSPTVRDWAAHGLGFLGEEAIPDNGSVRAMLPAMLASYDADSNLPSRRWGATNFFKEAIAKNPEVKREIINGMAQSLNRLKIRDGFEQPIDANNIFETLRYVDMKKRPFVASMKRIRPELEAMTKSPGKQSKNTQQALARLDQVVKEWEDKFGEVKGN